MTNTTKAKGRQKQYIHIMGEKATGGDKAETNNTWRDRGSKTRHDAQEANATQNKTGSNKWHVNLTEIQNINKETQLKDQNGNAKGD